MATPQCSNNSNYHHTDATRGGRDDVAHGDGTCNYGDGTRNHGNCSRCHRGVVQELQGEETGHTPKRCTDHVVLNPPMYENETAGMEMNILKIDSDSSRMESSSSETDSDPADVAPESADSDYDSDFASYRKYHETRKRKRPSVISPPLTKKRRKNSRQKMRKRQRLHGLTRRTRLRQANLVRFRKWERKRRWRTNRRGRERRRRGENHGPGTVVPCEKGPNKPSQILPRKSNSKGTGQEKSIRCVQLSLLVIS